MKTLFTFLATVLLITTLQAKIVYLNNELAEPNISENLYTNWADAYAAASAGDTIYVYGSAFDYGEIGISKPLTIIGPGYFLTENLNTQTRKKVARFGEIALAEGSSNTTISGVVINIANRKGLILSEPINSIKINNCYIDQIRIDTKNGTVFNNIQIKKCFISSQITICSNYCNGIVTNYVIANNIINGTVSIADGSSGIIANNLITTNVLNIGTSSSFEVANNIFLNTNTSNFTIQPLPDASIHHNISLTGAFGNANDNFTAPQSTLFVSGDNTSTDGKYMLSENSPAKGKGSNGTDIGPFGGPDPYRLSGLPNLPNIYELSTGGFVSGNELPVTIKIKQ